MPQRPDALPDPFLAHPANDARYGLTSRLSNAYREFTPRARATS
jgi:hypothetical protein